MLFADQIESRDQVPGMILTVYLNTQQDEPAEKVLATFAGPRFSMWKIRYLARP
jgi:hypothetical protein